MFDRKGLIRKPSMVLSSTKMSLLTFMLIIAFAASMASLLAGGYRQTMSEAQAEIDHVAKILENNITASLTLAHEKMLRITDEMVIQTASKTRSARAAVHPLTKQAVDQIEQIDNIVVIDEGGRVISTTVEGLDGADLSDRAYFKKAMTLARGEYEVADPIISRGSDGAHITPIAWPLAGPGEKAQGVVVSSLEERYFKSMLAAADYRSDMTIQLKTAHGKTAFSILSSENAAQDHTISIQRKIPAFNLTLMVERPYASVLSGFFVTTLPLVGVATVLFISTLTLTIISASGARAYAKGLSKSEADRRRILAAEREFDLIFQNVYDGIVIFEDDGSILRSNRKARELLSAESNKEAVDALRSLLPEQKSHRTTSDGIEAEKPKSYTLVTGDRTLNCRVMQLGLSGTQAFYCVLNDLSAEDRLTETRNNFVVSINHELRTPLTSLSGSLALLGSRYQGQIPEKGMKLVTMASRNADRLLRLVNDILTLQAIDQHHLTLNMQTLPVSSVLSDAVTMNEGYGHSYGVEIDLGSLEQDAMIKVDSDRIQQIFSNLISNAVKYSPKGGVVRISADVRPDQVVFSVKDSGPGIPLQSRASVYDRFAKPAHAEGVQASGTGLGLSITRELVIKQGGEINMVTTTADEDPENHGTIFYFTFPTASHRHSYIKESA
jgi:signal transduction histidine kinase